MEGLIGILLFLAFWAIFGGIPGWLIARRKGRGTAGFWWGALLGIFGWVVAATLEPSDEVRRRRMLAGAAFMETIRGGKA